MFVFRQLQTKLFVSFVLLVLIPLLTLGFFSFRTATSSLEKETEQNQAQTVRLIGNNIKLMLDDAGDITSYIMNNVSLQSLLSRDFNGPVNVEQAAALAYLDNIKTAKKYVSFLVIYGQNGFLYRDFSEFFRQVIPYTDFIEMPLYTAVASRDGEAFWTYSSTSLFTYGHSYNEIMIGRRIVDLYDPDNKLGLLFMGVNRDAIGNIIQDIEIVRSSNIFIFDDNYNLVSSKSQNIELKKTLTDDLGLKRQLSLKTHSEIYNINGKRYSVASTVVEPYNWNIVSLTPLEIIQSEHRIMLNVTLALSLSLLALVGLCSVFLSRSITRPIKKLLRSMNNFKRGDFNQKVEVTSRDEIGLLTQKYNDMVIETNSLIQKVYISQTKQKMIELKTLQTQIEPHFLYNTLDYIFLNSKMNGDDNTAQVTQSLAELFRLSLNKGKDYYMIRQELSQVKAYIHIQHARFPNRFVPRYEIDPDILPYYTMKLLLQPLAENAILHAFNMKRERPGTLLIRGRKLDGQRVEFVVEDDGCGMSPELANSLLSGDDGTNQATDAISGKAGGTGYGIRNVNERLTMMFGPEYALRIESEPGDGTRVLLVIPLISDDNQWRLLYENHGH
ncbi:sensor histidine kinase [Paenibacillus lutimineralis]|uniref:histidine kinase n=1 Tax=Paenibacillus lutimineralis TaxID=2707005 RepID=A0A3Q9IFI1_9BACL|nr:sensor histidine kinase [Paenibacillus lutimineralis]AZS17907.1 sensor histidine kinase [Paenibacillus lutimineralis]